MLVEGILRAISVINALIHVRHTKYWSPNNMSRSFGLVDYKVQEAEYFLLELKRLGKGLEFHGIQFCASAFVSAARSVTFAMQASLKGNDRFDAWYAKKQKGLKENALARFFHDFRNVTQHIGANVVGGGAHGSDGTFHFFVACQDLPTVPDQDVLSACEEYFVLVLQLVYDCYVEMGSIVNGQLYFTEEHFASVGKSIEDAEEELGFPRGYTDIGKPELHLYRWEMLRRQADGCLIDRQFARWLGQQVPGPEKLPRPVI